MTELLPNLSILLLILVRVSAFFVSVPLFSYRTIPQQVRIILAVALAWMMYYTFNIEPFEINAIYLLLVLKEAIIGLMLGLAAMIIVSAVQIAGDLSISRWVLRWRILSIRKQAHSRR